MGEYKGITEAQILAGQLRQAQAELTAVRAERDAALAELRHLHWSARNDHDEPCCLSCGEREVDGDDPHCSLAAVLARAAGTNPDAAADREE